MNEESNAPEPSPVESVQPASEPQAEASAPQSIVMPPQPKKSRKKWLITLLILLLIAAGVVAWLLFGNHKNTTQPAVTTKTSSSTTVSKPLVPPVVAYAAGDPIKANVQLFWHTLSGGQPTEAGTIGAHNGVGESGVYKNKIFVTTTPYAGGSDGPMVWYSKDSGKTYTKVFTGAAASGSQSLGSQITSAKFSSDGSSIVIGYLSEGRTNTVKEINPDTKNVKDLFSSSAAGVFLSGYDRAAHKVYYYTGCYNCDGVSFNKLYVRDTVKDVESTVYEDTAKAGFGTTMNSDLSKALLIKNEQSGYSASVTTPYTVEELDIASKTVKTLATITQEAAPSAGYRTGDNVPYYTKANTVYAVIGDAPIALFESIQPIQSLYFVGKDQIVFSSGTFEKFQLSRYTIKDKSITNILSGDTNTHIFGVVWE